MGGTKMSPHNVVNTPVLRSSLQPKTLWRHGLLLREISGYLGKQLKPVPHHL